MTEEFHRIRRLPPYVFAEVNAAKASARAAAEDIVDLGMGNPDSPTPPHIVAKLVEAVQDPRTHRYSTSKGIPGLRRALANYYARRFGVPLDAETEVVVTLGSKEGLANLANAIASPGDTILVPNPSYPIHQFGFIIAGASVRSLPCTPDDEMLAAIDRAVRHSVPKPTAVIVNFPSNPTAHLASIEFYRELVALCRRHELFILSDLAYAELYFGDTPPPSVLEVPGAKEVAVEFTSMSKTYNMPGWRVGFAAGNPRLIAALARVKSYLDYGAFTPIQVAATAALNGPQENVAAMRALYRERRDLLVKGLRAAGWEVPMPEGSMFVWAPIPERFRHLGSVEFSKLLLARAKVAVAPGLGFGEHGDGHVRIALVENGQRIRQALRGIRGFLQGDNAGPLVEAPAAAEWAGMSAPLRIGVAGLGTVGAGLVRLLQANAEIVAARAGRPVVVAAVSARDRGRDRGVDLGEARWHEDPVALAAEPGLDAVVELIGGSEGPARRLVEAALRAGRPVVTANKALLAIHGAELAELAAAKGVPLAFEAAVAGGIPVIKALREGLAANRIGRVAGILNGTCNYILTAMREQQAGLRGGARRGAAARLRRGRPGLRHRRRGRGAQALHPRGAGLRTAGGFRGGACGGHPRHQRARHRARGGAGLPHQAARHRVLRARRRRFGAGASLHGAGVGAHRRGGRGVQRGGGGRRLRRAAGAGRARRRGGADRERRRGRPDRSGARAAGAGLGRGGVHRSAARRRRPCPWSGMSARTICG